MYLSFKDFWGLMNHHLIYASFLSWPCSWPQYLSELFYVTLFSTRQCSLSTNCVIAFSTLLDKVLTPLAYECDKRVLEIKPSLCCFESVSIRRIKHYYKPHKVLKTFPTVSLNLIFIHFLTIHLYLFGILMTVFWFWWPPLLQITVCYLHKCFLMCFS